MQERIEGNRLSAETRSIIRPSSTVARPATLCPPPRTATSSPSVHAKLTGVDDVGRPVAARDEGRPLVDEPVVDVAGVVVTDVVPLQELARERRRDLGDRIGERHLAPPELTSA